MTKTAASKLTSVLVPYFSKAGKYQKVETYRVTRTSTGYTVAGPRGANDVLLQDGELLCPCEGFRMSIEKNGDDLPAFCRHLCLIAAAHIMVAEIRAEATEDPQPRRLALVRPVDVPQLAAEDWDPFCVAA